MKGKPRAAQGKNFRAGRGGGAGGEGGRGGGSEGGERRGRNKC